MSETTIPRAPRNALAVASLALGVTGLVLAPLIVGAFFGVLALIVGFVALSRGSRKGLAAGGVVTGLLSIPVALAVLGIFLIGGTMPQRAREAASLTNLRGLNTALTVYAADWNGAVPERLANLAPYIGDMTRVIRDPRLQRRRPGPLPPATNPAELQAILDRECDYWYAGAGLTVRHAAVITFYDRGVPGGRRLVAFADGHVASFQPDSPELQAAVERNNQARQTLHLPPLPLALDGPPPSVAGSGPEQ